jgi:acyl-CoA thioester hydrolase
MTENPSRPARTDFSFWCRIAVRWGDMDALGHVNNAVYMTYLESARIAFFERWGWRFPGERPGTPVVVSQTFNYRQEVTYPAVLEIGVRCTGVRRRSFVLAYAVFQQGSDLLFGDGSTALAWVDTTAGRAVAVPDDVRRLLTEPR